MWRTLRRQGIEIGREQTARLMRLAGVAGKDKDRSPVTTRKPKGPDLRPEMVNRDFKADKSNRLWVGRYYLRANPERLCVHRFRHGWVLPPHCRPRPCPIRCELQALPMRALNQAIACTRETTALIHHSDHGSQYVSIVYNERLAEHKIIASTGTFGDSYDNALAENVNGSYKNELIHNRTWNAVVDVEIATFEWVTWWNETRLHQGLGYRTPAEVKSEFCQNNPGQEIIEIKANA